MQPSELYRGFKQENIFVRGTWLGNLATNVSGHIMTQLTRVSLEQHLGDAVLVTFEGLGAVLHVVNPAPDREVCAARVEGLGSHYNLEDHPRVTLKILYGDLIFICEWSKEFTCSLLLP